MISLKGVNKSFGPVQAVTDMNFEINAGEVVGFLGPNGAGKSTTMRMITGFLKPTSGTVTIANLDIGTHPVLAKSKIGYLPESAALYTEMEVTDFLFFMGRMRGLNNKELKERLKVVVAECQLSQVLGRKIAELSKGYRQRVGLAQALLHDPTILILDEPTVGLDPNQIGEIRELIKEIGKKKTILLSTHILSEVSATCQRVLIINNGKIVATGSPETLVNDTSGAAQYKVSVRGVLDEINDHVKKIPHYENHVVSGSDQDKHDVIIRCNSKEDLSEDIFDLAVANKWRLSRLIKEEQSLEDVFKRLTK